MTSPLETFGLILLWVAVGLAVTVTVLGILVGLLSLLVRFLTRPGRTVRHARRK